jgi:hypothetical protein
MGARASKKVRPAREHAIHMYIDESEARAILDNREQFRNSGGQTDIRRLTQYHNQTYHHGKAMLDYKVVSAFLRHVDENELSVRDF